MKLEVETKNILIGFGIISLCLILNVLADTLFPYEIIRFGIDNEWNYSMNQFLSLISAIPLTVFFVWLGYLIGRKKYEKPIKTISD